MLKKALILVCTALLLFQCRKDRIDEDNISTSSGIQLSFSDQVVLFDTVFTTVGSTTRYLKVYNNSSSSIKISSIRLVGVDNAVFRMNVDGEPGDLIKDVYLAGKDSLFIFVDVTIDPNSATLPFIVEGKIEFLTNGNRQEVSLVAYGQQAYFITPTTFPENLPPYSIVMGKNTNDTTWDNTLPIVVYGYAVVDSTQHLTIEKGTQIHFHANSGLWVYRYGQLTVNGTLDEPVVFQGDRLDGYKDVSGSWDRIWINEGEAGNDNTFEYAIIKNSFIGIQAEYNPFRGLKDGVSANQLNLINTTIDNTEFAGILGSNYKILGQNLLVTNSGSSNFVVAGGGAYVFQHSTFANYWRGSIRNTPSVFLSHLYFDFEERAFRQDSMVVHFQNSIIWGDQDSEFNIEEEVDPGEKINFTMDHVLFRSSIETDKYGTYSDTLFNREWIGVFANPYGDDFSPASTSPTIDFGATTITGPPALNINNPPLDLDLNGNARVDGKPDLGAIEFQ